MARAAHKELDLKPLIEIVGLKKVIDQIGWDRVIDELRKKKAIPQFLERLSPRRRLNCDVIWKMNLMADN